jgi:hypothetical protein
MFPATLLLLGIVGSHSCTAETVLKTVKHALKIGTDQT